MTEPTAPPIHGDAPYLQRQVDDLHGAAIRLLDALEAEPQRTHVAMSRQTLDAARALAGLLALQDASDTAIMVKEGRLFVAEPRRQEVGQ